jgi:hypothetical protein
MDREPVVVAGRWWRFTKYEIRDGSIRSAPGAELQLTDPWAAYRDSRQGRTRQAPPYESLLGVLRNLSFQVSKTAEEIERVELTPEGSRALLGWCETFGLLGILLNRTLMVTLGPRWERQRGRTGNGDLLRPVQRGYVRTTTGWRPMRPRQGMPFARPTASAWTLVGSPVRADLLPRRWPTAGAIVDVGSTGVQEESLSRTWAKFFPDVPARERETWAYPIPLSEDFWRHYAEPLDDFLFAVLGLRQTLERLTTSKSRPHENDAQTSIEGDIQSLQRLVASVSPTLKRPRRGGFAQQWHSSSLLGSLAMMALLDLTEQRRVVACRVCDRVFVTSAWQGRYCSPRCRWTAQKRASRAKKRKRQRRS